MSNNYDACYIFVGPSSYGLDLSDFKSDPNLHFLPPVKRGDIERLVEKESPSYIAIVDGQFQECLAVAHKEIRDAIEYGWHIFGLSSMGAVRAYEMRCAGMHGYGKIYEEFSLHEDFRDDEVALLHSPMPPYFPASEPLVHIRQALNDLHQRGILSHKSRVKILSHLLEQWFGDRTLEKLRSLLFEETGVKYKEIIDNCLGEFQEYRIKNHDLKSFLESRAWKSIP